MRYTARISAGAGERFAESAAERMIGQRPRITIRGELIDHGQVTVAAVVDDGRAIEFTVEWSGQVIELPTDLPPMSFRFER